MDNRTRAEKIWRTLRGAKALPMLSTPERDINFITSQLDEAVKEAVREAVEFERTDAGMTINWKDGFDKGFAAAREKAAGMKNDFCLHYIDDFGSCGNCVSCEYAETIRAMKDDK